MADDGRIRDDRFAQGREREVDYSPHYRDRTGLVSDDLKVAKNLLEIVRCLGAGNLLPEKFYRNGIDRDSDDLLRQHGIKHLHLHPDTEVDTLLFLVEYRDFVVFLEVDGHRHHFAKPPGAVLRSLHDSAIRNADAKAEKIKSQKITAARGGLLPRANVATGGE